VTSFTSRGDPEHILQAISEEFGVRIDHLTPSPLPRATAVASVTHRTNQMRASSLRFPQELVLPFAAMRADYACARRRKCGPPPAP
jgi:hypothetical protein